MVYKAIGLRADVFQCHPSSYGKLEQMNKVIYRFIGFIYSLVLFIRFGGFIYWIYLLAFFIHCLYLFDLVDLFIGFIYWL